MSIADMHKQTPVSRRQRKPKAEQALAVRRRTPHDHGPDSLAGGLGWFSLGLGAAELAAPGKLARLIGVPDHEDSRSLLRAAGMREIASGFGILSNASRPTGWLWARVAGDVMDLALLGAAFNSQRARRKRVALAAAAVLGVTLVDVLSSQRSARVTRHERRLLQPPAAWDVGVTLRQAITVNRPADEVYRFWRDLQNLPRFMSHLIAVEPTGERTTHWRARGPLGTEVDWEAEIVEDTPDRSIAWRTLHGDIDHAGRVRFEPAPGKRGTEVHVQLHYLPPAGATGAVIARLFGALPEQQIRRDLKAFKQVLETGEVVQSDASIHRLPHPAQPPARERSLPDRGHAVARGGEP